MAKLTLMALPPAGWYQDPAQDRPELQRWWDGTQWTEHRQSAEHSAQPEELNPGWLKSLKPKPSTIIAGIIFLSLALVGFSSGGISGFLIILALITIGTGLYTLVTKRPSWAQLPSRKTAGLAAGLGVLALIGGAVIAPQPEIPPSAQQQQVEPEIKVPVETEPKKVEKPQPDLDVAPLDPPFAPKASFIPSVVATDSSFTAKSAMEALESLPVKGRAPKTGYERSSKFGTPWMDVDDNGCDTRNDVLARDLIDIKLSGSCKVQSGTLEEQYSGKTLPFLRGNETSALVQVDHVVSLSDAWQKGAQQLSPEQRTTFANDPLNLIAVDGKQNALKGSGDAATWLPQNKAFRCEYVARQVSVKVTYGLWVTQAEKDAVKQILETCPGQQAYTSQFTPAPEPPPVEDTKAAEPQPFVATPDPAPAPEPEPAPAPAPSAYYKNCTAARDAGAAPVYAGDPGYGRHLDRDGDGVGCE